MKEILSLKRELVSRSDMKSIIKRLSNEDDAIRWAIERAESKEKTSVRPDTTPEHQKAWKVCGWFNKLKTILP